ncbi:MAG: hypothetical protein K2W96_11585, partial [Gemmataceae bacterium]|nr:hypothetical protein [Gemmataceae bacterium]
PPRVTAYIDLTKGRFITGLDSGPVQVQLPQGWALAQEPPRNVSFELLPGDFKPDGLGLPSPATPREPER